MIFKDTASQKIDMFCFDYTTGAPKTGDAAQLTCYVSKDNGTVTVLGDTSATEMDATNAKGLYLFDITQTESNADKLIFSGKSSTSNVTMVPRTIYTRPNNVIFSGSVTGAASTTQLIDSKLTESGTDHWKGRILIFTSGTLRYQATDITAFTPASDQLTYTALTASPSAADTYIIL